MDNKREYNEYQAILARDMIDMIRDYADDADVMVYLDAFAFSLARMLGGQIVDWDAIAGTCDQRYWSLGGSQPIPLNTKSLDRCERQIQRYIPSKAKEELA
jgi:hypothetical protein